MAIGKISGVMLQSNLERQGIDLSLDTDLIYLNVASRLVGINTINPNCAMSITGNVNAHNYFGLTVSTGNLTTATANVLQTATIASNTTISSTQINISANTASTDYYTGAIVVAGGVGIDGNLNVRGNITTSNLFVNGGNLTNVNIGNLTFTNTTISNSLVNGNITLDPTGTGYVIVATNIASTSYYTGALVVQGGTGVDGNLNVRYAIVGNTVTANSIYSNTANLGNITASNNTISSSNANGNIILDPNGTGTVNILGGQSTSYDSGALVVSGGVGIAGNLNVSGTANVANLIVAGGSFTNVNLGNITVTNTTISSTLVEGNVTLKPSGAGLVYIDTTTALALPSGNTAQEPTSPPAGAIRYNTDLTSVEFYNGTSWIPTTASIDSQSITPNGIANTFTLDRPTTTGGILVLLNGVMQSPTTAYSVSGNQITFTEVPQSTDIVDIRFIATGEVTSSDIKASPAPVYISATPTTIDSYSISNYRTAKYLVQVSDAANVSYQSSEILVTHNNTIPTISVYGTVYTSSNLVGFTATLTSGNVNLKATSTGANCAVKIQKTYIAT